LVKNILMTTTTSSNFMVTSLVRTNILKPKKHVTTNTLHQINFTCLPKNWISLRKNKTNYIWPSYSASISHIHGWLLIFMSFHQKKTFLFYEEIKQRHSRNLYEKKIRQHAKKAEVVLRNFCSFFHFHPSLMHRLINEFTTLRVFINSLLIYFKMWFIIAWTEKKH